MAHVVDDGAVGRVAVDGDREGHGPVRVRGDVQLPVHGVARGVVRRGAGAAAGGRVGDIGRGRRHCVGDVDAGSVGVTGVGVAERVVDPLTARDGAAVRGYRGL